MRALARRTFQIFRLTENGSPSRRAAGKSTSLLLEATEPDSAVASFIERRGEGLHHVAIRTPDFEAAIDRLKAAGARLVGEPREGAGGHTYVFVHPDSASGVLLELIKSRE